MNNENLEVYPLFAKTIVRTQVDLEGTDLSKIEWVQNYQNNISTSQAFLRYSLLNLKKVDGELFLQVIFQKSL